MKILYMGTPDFAVPPLKALVEAGHSVVGVITQPDKPTGRGYQLTPPPVKVAAQELGIPVYQPETLKNGAITPLLESLAPELIAVAAYGKILPVSVLEVPRFGCLNVHASLLPKYRGAAPIHHAVMNGEKETGVTIMFMEKGLDTGDMLLAGRTPITPEDTTGILHDRLSLMGATLLVEAIRLLAEGKITPVKQNEAEQTYAPMLQKSDCKLDFSLPAEAVRCRIHGLSPFPGAFLTLDGKTVKVFRARVCEECGKPGTVLYADGAHGLVIACGEKSIRLSELRPEGKKTMTDLQFINGARLIPGAAVNE